MDEGNADRARQIANEHLDPRTRDSVLQKVEFQLIANKVEADNMDQLRQALAQLHSDDERIDLLLQMGTQSKDKKLAVKLLGEAQRLTNRRATSYRQFEQQLSVADAFATLEPARSFEVLDPGISQLNELLSAAAVLSGFEVNVFRDGEMPLEPNSTLTNMVARYGQQLAWLAKTDFDRAEMSANKFQMAEPRLLARLTIVRDVLSGQQFVLGSLCFVLCILSSAEPACCAARHRELKQNAHVGVFLYPNQEQSTKNKERRTNFGVYVCLLPHILSRPPAMQYSLSAP